MVYFPLTIIFLLLEAQSHAVNGFPCDQDDIVQLDYMPGLSRDTPFTSTRESRAGKDYCLNAFYKDCLEWCAYDSNCASIHFLLLIDEQHCVCHKCSLLRDLLPDPVPIVYGDPCRVMGYVAKICLSITCRAKQRQRMIDLVGHEYEEIPMLDARVWMSSVNDDDFVQYGPHLAVDDSIYSHSKHHPTAADMGYHWIIFELPYSAHITHLKVRLSKELMTNKKSQYGGAAFQKNPAISSIYLTDWQIVSVSTVSNCQDYAKTDYGVLGSLTFIFGKYFSSSYVCIVGTNIDPWMYRSSHNPNRLHASIKSGKCMLTRHFKPWKELVNCEAWILDMSFDPQKNDQGLQGAELLATAGMTSTPEALFSSHKNRNYRSNVPRYNRLISWKHWIHCGFFSQLLTRTSSGIGILTLNRACRSQNSLYLAIRNTEEFRIYDIQAFEELATKSYERVSPTYRLFSCPVSQFSGFTPEFIGSKLRPHLLNFTIAMNDIYKLFEQVFEGMKTKDRACSADYSRSRLHTTFMEDINNGRCAYSRIEISDMQKKAQKEMENIMSKFVSGSFDSRTYSYILNYLIMTAQAFLHRFGGHQVANANPMALRIKWTSYMIEELHPADFKRESLLKNLQRFLYSRKVSLESKLRSEVFLNAHICFIACHWALLVSSGAKTAAPADTIIPRLFGWFKEAFCPDPCASARCKLIDNSENGQCVTIDTGLWLNSYKCICKRGYYWSSGAGNCLPQQSCNRPRNSPDYPCSPNNTWYCESRSMSNSRPDNTTLLETEAICVCHEGFGGKRCERLADPCRDRHAIHGVTGNFACGSLDVNQFNATVGTCSPPRSATHAASATNWECHCRADRIRDLDLPFDNCAAHRNSCHAEVCIHGHFLSSKNGRLCHCKCDPGYSGSSCTIWTGIWSPWSPWDRCRPECSSSEGSRVSISIRSCINRQVLGEATPYDFCVGETQRWMTCDPALCWFGGDKPHTRSIRLRSHYLQVSAIIACVTATVLVWISFAYCRYRGFNIGPRPPFESVYS